MSRKIWGEWTVRHFVFLTFMLGVCVGALLVHFGATHD
jgi:hypothetical protein